MVISVTPIAVAWLCRIAGSTKPPNINFYVSNFISAIILAIFHPVRGNSCQAFFKHAALVLGPDIACVIDKVHVPFGGHKGAAVVVKFTWSRIKQGETPVYVICSKCPIGPVVIEIPKGLPVVTIFFHQHFILDAKYSRPERQWRLLPSSVCGAQGAQHNRTGKRDDCSSVHGLCKMRPTPAKHLRMRLKYHVIALKLPIQKIYLFTACFKHLL